MATYIQGVTDYIPRLQPFRPDFNFYSNILQTKEAQYQAGYEKLSNIYGTLLNSEMLRDDNINRRTEFFNKIDNDIKKIAGLDLSKQQNVSAAKQVFQPLIDDKYIQKDIVFTKNWRGQQSRAEALKNCTDPKKCGGQWWEGGVRALNYQAEDFRNASQDESLGFGNPTYTPYVDTRQKAMQFAKDMGFDTKTVTFSPDGRYRITTKNGPQVIPDLTKAFMNQTMSDPAAIEMYKTQAYLERKDFISANTQRFGSSEAAERDYLMTSINEINETQRKLKQESEQEKKDVQEQKDISEKSIANTPLNDVADANYIKYLESLDTQEEIANGTEALATDSLNQTNGIENMDIATMRYRVDLAKANNLLYGDMANTAYDYAMNTMEQEVEEDRYALAGYEHGLRMSEISAKAEIDYQMELLKSDLKKSEKLYEYTLENGGVPGSENTLGFDEQGMPVEAGPGGTSLIPGSKIAEEQLKGKSNQFQQSVTEKMTYVSSQLDAVINSPTSSPSEIAQAKKAKKDLFGTANIIVKEDNSQNNINQGLNVAQAASGSLFAGAAAGMISAGAATSWSPIGWGLLAAGGLTVAANGVYNYLKGNENSEANITTVSEGGYLDESGNIVNVAGHTDASNPNSPYNIENINRKLDSFISTEGNGLFRNNQSFKARAAQISASVEESKKLRDSAYNKSRKDNLAVRQRMVGLYGNDSGSELLVDDKGHKRSKEEFIREYTKKYQNAYDAFVNPAAKLVADVFMDDAEDVYDEATARFDRIYDRGEVSGLGIGINAISGGSANMQRGNRVFNFDAAEPGPLRAAIKDLYVKDIAPALANPAQKGAMFLRGDALAITAGDELVNDSNVQSLMSDLLKSSFSTKWKKTNDKRPLYDVTRVGMAANDPGKVAVTFTLDQDFLDDYKGSEKLRGAARDMIEAGQNKMSVLFDKSKVNSAFFASLEPSSTEFLLYNDGRYDVTGYEEFGGTGSIMLDRQTGQKSFSLNQKFYNPETRSLEAVNITDVGDFDVNDMAEQMRTYLDTLYQQNFNTLRTPSQEQTNE